jgi:hypothetical protein
VSPRLQSGALYSAEKSHGAGPESFVWPLADSVACCQDLDDFVSFVRLFVSRFDVFRHDYIGRGRIARPSALEAEAKEAADNLELLDPCRIGDLTSNPERIDHFGIDLTHGRYFAREVCFQEFESPSVVSLRAVAHMRVCFVEALNGQDDAALMFLAAPALDAHVAALLLAWDQIGTFYIRPLQSFRQAYPALPMARL